MVALIGDLLDAARLQAGQALTLERRPTDLVALVGGLVAEHQERTDRHTIRFEATVPSLVGAWDAERVERVVGNLLANAVKYSPAGGTIRVSVRREAEGGDPVAVVMVQDEGLGIPAADLARLFEPFHRASNVAEHIPGTGLGLASARHIIAEHGGTINLQSEEDRGTTVTVRLPLEGQRP